MRITRSTVRGVSAYAAVAVVKGKFSIERRQKSREYRYSKRVRDVAEKDSLLSNQPMFIELFSFTFQAYINRRGHGIGSHFMKSWWISAILEKKRLLWNMKKSQSFDFAGAGINQLARYSDRFS